MKDRYQTVLYLGALIRLARRMTEFSAAEMNLLAELETIDDRCIVLERIIARGVVYGAMAGERTLDEYKALDTRRDTIIRAISRPRDAL